MEVIKMNSYNGGEAIRIAMENGCQTAKEFAEFIKLYNEGLRVIKG